MQQAGKMFSTILTFLLFASANSCTPATLVHNGCSLQAPSGMTIDYALHNSTMDFAVKAPSMGFVGLSIVKSGQASSIPGDAVFGFGNGTVQKWQINGPSKSDWKPSGVPLPSVNITVASGFTTLRFTRRFDSGRYHISPKELTFFTYYGKNLTNATVSRIVANLLIGEPAAKTNITANNSTVSTSALSSSAKSVTVKVIALLSMVPFIV